MGFQAMPKESGSYLVGCDIGGTFTDLVLFDEATGEMVVKKVVTTPGDPSEAVVTGTRTLADSVPDYLSTPAGSCMPPPWPPTPPDFCLLLRGTGMRISLGNRGRVDLDVEIKGKATHSSAPGHGLSAIEGANEFVNRLNKLRLPGSHPILGERHVLAYQIVYEPLAPHTLPELPGSRWTAVCSPETIWTKR